MKTLRNRLSRNAVMVLVFFFGISLLLLPKNSEVLALLYDSETQIADSLQNNVLSQNSENEDSADSNANTDQIKESRWFRLKRENGSPAALQTSIVRYTGLYKDADGVEREISVDLIGAIHLAERSYYDSINAEFKEYETVVFELISPKGVDPKLTIRAEREAQEKKTREFHPLNIVSLVQVWMSRALGLVYQIDGIDYLADNLKRGDIDAEDFLIQLLANGDAVNFVLDTFFASFLAEKDGVFEAWSIALLVSHDRQKTLRRLMAVQLLDSALAEIEKSSKKTNGMERENVIIHLRNKKAIEAVETELRAGRSKLAIFYGAAHLPDLEKRLESELKLTRDPNTRWFTAWDLR